MEDSLDEELVNKNKSDFEFYRDFHNTKEAVNFTRLLDSQNIAYSLETSGTIIDSAIVGNGLIPRAILKIMPIDFKRVNALIAEQIETLDYSEISDHYLTQLDNEELKEIFETQEEWSPEDISIAKLILKKRGIQFDEEEISQLRQDRLQEIRKGKTGSFFWIAFYSIGIVCGLFITLFFLIAGFGMAFYYAYGRSTDVDGNKYFVYDEKTRKIGTIMLYGGIAVVILEIVLSYLSLIF